MHARYKIEGPTQSQSNVTHKFSVPKIVRLHE